MAKKPTLGDYERIIGIAPRKADPETQIKLKEMFNLDGQAQRNAVNNWLIANGIPDANARGALAESCARAYSEPRYLAAWRARVNPKWAAILGESETVLDEIEAENAKNPSITRAEVVAVAAEEFDRRTVGIKLKLSNNAREEVIQLAAKSTAQTLARLLPPREIAVTNAVTGESKNLGVQHFKFETLLKACALRDHTGKRLNIWLTGPTGSGKTTAAENAAKALGLNFHFDGSLDADYKVIGFRDAHGHVVETGFRKIFTNGGIYVADEIDNWNSSAILGLNAPLANGFAAFPDGMVERHPDCIIIACANTWGLGAMADYVGRARLDAATLDRFMPKIDWPYDNRLETAIAVNIAGDLGRTWADYVQTARNKALEQGLKFIISPRATYNGAAMLINGFNVEEIIDVTVAAGLAPEQRESIGLDRIPSELAVNV